MMKSLLNTMRFGDSYMLQWTVSSFVQAIYGLFSVEHWAITWTNTNLHQLDTQEQILVDF